MTAVITTDPTILQRIRIFVRHGSRILFRRWPNYTFADLAACQDAADGPAFQAISRRMRESETGRRILEQRPEISVNALDWRWLSTLPIDTLGYNFWHHFYSNGILEDLDLGKKYIEWDPETEFAKKRYRETHDARHVLVGLGIDGYEEIVLQTFQFAQQPQILSAGIVLLGGLKHLLLDWKWREIFSGVPQAWRAGKAAHELILIYLEELWEVPLEEVRARYGIKVVGKHYPVTERHPDAPWTPPEGWVPPSKNRMQKVVDA
jgi:ubiquinone biosynthesis protein COQ4